MMDDEVKSVLGFWFGDASDGAAMAQQQAKLWWGKDAAVDAEMRSRFAGLLQRAMAGELDAWAASPAGLLALIVLTDQFPRNIHRGTPLAFAADELARRWARLALERGVLAAMRPIERVFCYLPFEHSESLTDQELAVSLFETLAQEALASGKEAEQRFAGFADYARRHLEIVRRFGRFPHRNTILGRASTPEEIEFLKQPGSSF